MTDFAAAVRIESQLIGEWKKHSPKEILMLMNATGGKLLPSAVIFASAWDDIANSELEIDGQKTTLEQAIVTVNPFTVATGAQLRIFVERKVESMGYAENRRKGRELFESMNLTPK